MKDRMQATGVLRRSPRDGNKRLALLVAAEQPTASVGVVAWMQHISASQPACRLSNSSSTTYVDLSADTPPAKKQRPNPQPPAAAAIVVDLVTPPSSNKASTRLQVSTSTAATGSKRGPRLNKDEQLHAIVYLKLHKEKHVEWAALANDATTQCLGKRAWNADQLRSACNRAQKKAAWDSVCDTYYDTAMQRVCGTSSAPARQVLRPSTTAPHSPSVHNMRASSGDRRAQPVVQHLQFKDVKQNKQVAINSAQCPAIFRQIQHGQVVTWFTAGHVKVPELVWYNAEQLGTTARKCICCQRNRVPSEYALVVTAPHANYTGQAQHMLYLKYRCVECSAATLK